MPGLDGKGPQGQGSMTGRGLGRCADGKNVDETGNVERGEGTFFARGRGVGRGGGRGLGRGMRNRFFAPNAANADNGKE